MEKLILLSFLADAFFACMYFKRRNKLYMPFAALIPLIMSAATAAYKGIKGAQQKKKAAKLRQSNYVPPSLEESLANTRLAAGATSPEYLRSQEKLRLSTSNAINNLRRAGGSAGAIQQSVADADAREKEMLKDLGVSDAATKQAARQDLNQQLGQKAGYQKESYDAMNAAKSALLGASEQNKYGAMTSALEGIGNFAAGFSGGGGGAKVPTTGTGKALGKFAQTAGGATAKVPRVGLGQKLRAGLNTWQDPKASQSMMDQETMMRIMQMMQYGKGTQSPGIFSGYPE